MVTVFDTLKNAKKLLNANEIENADFEAVCIFEKAYGVKYRSVQYERIKDTEPSDEQSEALCEMLRKRIDGQPLQYVLGEWEFFGMPFKVGSGVLIPRQDTETLVELVLDKMKNNNSIKAVDLCAGSGCIGVALQKNLRSCDMTCVEISKDAVKYLEQNIKLNDADVKTLNADVLKSETADAFSQLDLIVCNPPYLTKEDMQSLQTEVGFEPQTALFGGEDGLDFYREITRLWKNTLKQGGMLAYEIGMGQETDVSQILIQHGFENVRFVKDYCGIFRVVYGYKGEN